jgi:hypothetical protein
MWLVQIVFGWRVTTCDPFANTVYPHNVHFTRLHSVTLLVILYTLAINLRFDSLHKNLLCWSCIASGINNHMIRQLFLVATTYGCCQDACFNRNWDASNTNSCFLHLHKSFTVCHLFAVCRLAEWDGRRYDVGWWHDWELESGELKGKWQCSER